MKFTEINNANSSAMSRRTTREWRNRRDKLPFIRGRGGEKDRQVVSYSKRREIVLRGVMSATIKKLRASAN